MTEDMEKYLVKVKKMEILFDILVDLLENNKGQDASAWDKGYLNHLSVKFCFHLSSILKLLPESKLYLPILNIKLFDFSSICVLSRSMIETFIKFLYVIKENDDSELQHLKYLVFEYHSEKKRLNLLKLNNVRMNKKITELELQVEKLWKEINQNPKFVNFKNLSKDVKKGRKAFIFSDKDICDSYDISIDYYNMIFRYLSQYIHPLPFGAKQMSQLSQSVDDIYLLLNPTLDYCICFCHLYIHFFLTAIDKTKYLISDELKIDMEQSFYITKHISETIFDR